MSKLSRLHEHLVAKPDERRIFALGLGMLLLAMASVIYILGQPTIGLSIFGVTVVAMAFLLTDRDAGTVTTAFLVTLLLLPSRFVIGPLGAIGTPAKLIAIAGLIWWLGTRLDPELGGDHGSQPMRIALLAYLWWSLLAFSTAFVRPLSEVEASSATRTLIEVVALTGLALLVADGVAERSRLDVLLRRMVALVGITAAFGLLQFAGFDPVQYLRIPGLSVNLQFQTVAERSQLPRVSGTAIHAIEFGVLLAVAAPFALHYAFYGPRRIAAGIWCVLILAAVPTAVSRSAVVVLAISLGILALKWSWNRRLWLLVASLVFMLVARAAAPGLLGTLRALFLWWGADDSIEGRTKDYLPIYNYVSDSPVFGRGLGTFEPSEYFFLDNEWLMAAVTSGVPGVLFLLALFVVGLSLARGVRRRTLEESTAHLSQVFLGVIAGFAVAFGTYDALSFNITAGLFFFILGAVGAFWRLEVGSWMYRRDPETYRLMPERRGFLQSRVAPVPRATEAGGRTQHEA